MERKQTLDLISKSELLRQVQIYLPTFSINPSKIVDLITNAPVYEEPHGEWIEHKWAEEFDGCLISNYECSHCHSWKRENTDFCPDCGTDMRRGEQNEI